MSDEHTRRSRTAAQMVASLYARTVRGHLEASGFDAYDYLAVDELAQYHAAEHVALEQTLDPPAAAGKVIVVVLGGVAEVTSKPDDVEVTIIDHDNEASSALDHFLERVDLPQVPEDKCGYEDDEA